MCCAAAVSTENVEIQQGHAMKTWHTMIAGLAVGWATATSSGLADTVQLVNGDTVSGEVLSLDGKELKLQSKLLGALSIERAKIKAVFFGDARPPSAGGPSPAGQQGAAGKGSPLVGQMKAQGIDPQAFKQLENAFPQLAPKAKVPGKATPEDVLGQLRREGLDESIRKQIQQAFPLLGASEAQEYFDKTVSGLVSGDLSIQDVRNDAIRARDQLLDLQKDLGPAGKAALSAYTSILNRFIRETAPPEQEPEPKKSPSAQKNRQ